MNFTKNGYENIFKNGLENGYEFHSFGSSSNTKKTFLLRHDIDVSPKLALEMARIENGLKIKATYFFMLRSPFYNLFSRANNEIVKKIISMGHAIGLHYDEGYYSQNIDLQLLIDNEIKVLENNFDIKVNVVSFHQPSQKVINNDIKIKQINTYDKEFFSNIKYISDSNMSFKENPFDILTDENFSKVQLLVHPIWWMIEGQSTEEKFINAVKLNFEIEQKQVLATERAYGNEKKIILEVENGIAS